MESKLDDACVEISSRLSDGEELSIIGTLVKATRFIVSKNSMVKENPMIKLVDSEVELEVIARDTENDLILLKSPTEYSAGIDISSKVGEVPGTAGYTWRADKYNSFTVFPGGLAKTSGLRHAV